MFNNTTDHNGLQPEIVITEQPISKGYRFRYKCEGKTAGTVPGRSSTSKRKSVPSIRINNVPPGCGVVVVISCVTAEEPYRPHPHQLVGKDCEKGVCTIKLKRTNCTSLQGVGIQCVKKTAIPDALELRQRINVDPFEGGYFEEDYNYDAKKVRFAIQAFLNQDTFQNQNTYQPIPPVVTDIIHDCKADSALSICRTSKSSCYAKGADEVFLFCEKVIKDDIAVQFYEEDEHSGTMDWEALANFNANDVHKQYGIAFTTPPYKNQDITYSKKVWVRLYRPSDQSTSEPVPFTYTPNDYDPHHVEHKRKRHLPQLPNKISQIPVTALPTMLQTSASSNGARPKRTARTSTVTKPTVGFSSEYVSVNSPASNDSASIGTPLLEEFMPIATRVVSQQHVTQAPIPAVVDQFQNPRLSSLVPDLVPEQRQNGPIIAQPSDSDEMQPPAVHEIDAQYLLNSISSNSEESSMFSIPADTEQISVSDYLLLSDISEDSLATLTLEEVDEDYRNFMDFSKLQTDSKKNSESSKRKSERQKKKSREKVS